MIIDMNYWSKVFHKILILFFSILGIYLAFKLAIFYIPFLIAFIIAQVIEPLIRFCMRHFKWKRKVSVIVVFIIVLSILVGILIGGISALISEASNLLAGLNDSVQKVTTQFNEITKKFDLTKLKIPDEMIEAIQNSGENSFQMLAEWIKNILTSVLNVLTSLPSICVYTVICILALFFICADKIYMIDQIEHHLPKVWVRKLSKHIKEITKSLGQYLKAQGILVLVSFLVCLIGLYIFKIVGLNVTYPLLFALVIAFVDALPILGSSAVMIPWAIISSANGDFTLGICILVLLAIMSITKQVIEPKIVSGKIGIHPIFTLIAMYTGFKTLGIFGTLLGPIVLIILKNIFASIIDKGVAKSIFDREI